MAQHASRLRVSLKTLASEDLPSSFRGHGICALFALWTVLRQSRGGRAHRL